MVDSGVIPARAVPRLMPRALHISVYITLTRQHILNLDTLHFREILTKEDTVNSLITHTPRWTTQAMGYGGIWAMREQFGRKFGFGSCPKLWGMGKYSL